MDAYFLRRIGTYDTIRSNLTVANVFNNSKIIVNVKGLINARNIIGINKTGKQEAKNAAEQLEKTKIDLIFCSPLRRTKQTCKIINKNNIQTNLF